MATQVAGIVQARMGSTRLPGKVLQDIAGKSMLDWVLTRAGRSAVLDELIVATSTLRQDDAIVNECRRLGIRVERGEPFDVLSRYADVARKTEAEVIVRVTADCPFVDPTIVSQVVNLITDGDGAVDYASNTLAPRTFPRGLDVEALTAKALFQADLRARGDHYREHVTPYVRLSGAFRLQALRHQDDLSTIRWTVDTVDDLQLVRFLAHHFEGRDDMSWTELLDAWRGHPEWHRINAHVQQKER